MSPDSSYDLLERIGNLLRTAEREAAAAYGLQPVHLAALRYLSRANRYSDKPTAVAEYLGLTKGTVSQSLLLLEREGYLSKTADSQDKRASHLRVTEKGKRLLRRARPPEALPHELENKLRELLRWLQKSNESRTFGVCRTCRYFKVENEANGQFRCGLTSERLTTRDSGKICREHEI